MVKFGFTSEKKGTSPKLVNQVHGNAFRWMDRTTPLDADAVLTHSNEEIYIFTADCLPVLLYSDHPNSPIAAIHAGWKGLRAEIVPTVWNEIKVFNGPWHAVLGPALLKCCFEVKEDFPLRNFLEKRDGKTFFDPIQLLKSTQLAPEITLNTKSLQCTYCQGLPSFRRNKSTDPHIRGWIKKIPTA